MGRFLDSAYVPQDISPIIVVWLSYRPKKCVLKAPLYTLTAFESATP
ncbi:hypothetical protein N9N03_00455 [Chlamydiia bacterium]|nr:hypothetical protein [Chlamydiia bacterium]